MAKRVKYHRGVSKYIGLMFSKKNKELALVFEFKKEQIIPIHMFFVFFPIDLIFLDKHKKVVELKEDLRPFNFYKPENKAKYIIELNKGTIEKTRASLGDKLEF